MKTFKSWFTSPTFWFVFGVLGFPFVVLLNEFAAAFLVGHFRLLHGRSVHPWGWGGWPGLFLGFPLGLFSAAALDCWKWGWHTFARSVAFMAAVGIGGWWLWYLLHCDPFVWLGDFGFAVTPLAWAGGLLGFAFWRVSLRLSEARPGFTFL